MTDRIDVLAVIDGELATLPNYKRWGEALGYTVDDSSAVARLTQARAAMAELIEAAEYMLAPEYRGPDQDALRAALANVWGA